MSWTDERIETLRKLWSDGLSASQIANTLGGVTRNAVIGKIHRLGLSGRVKAPQARAARQRVAAAARPRPAQPRVMAVSSAAVKMVEREIMPPPPAEVVPINGGITLDDLSTSTCRWPVGDPAHDGFRFCGARAGEGEVYCKGHAEAAYPARGRVAAKRG